MVDPKAPKDVKSADQDWEDSELDASEHDYQTISSPPKGKSNFWSHQYEEEYTIGDIGEH